MLGLLEMLLSGLTGELFSRLVLHRTDISHDDRMNDPVYKKNVQRLIERSRKFEEARQ